MPRDPEFEQILQNELPKDVKLEPLAPLFNGVKMSILLRRTERVIANGARRFQDADQYYEWAVAYYNKIVAKIGEKLVFEHPKPMRVKTKAKPPIEKPKPNKAVRTPRPKPTSKTEPPAAAGAA